MKKHGHALIALLFLCFSTCFLFAPLVLSPLTGEERFFEWDVPEQYWPDLVYLCDGLSRGQLPYWNPFDRGGYPYYADPQAGTYHPLNWAICAVAGPSPELYWAEFRVVLSFFLAGAFGLLWLRQYRIPWGAALFGAVVIQCAPFMRHNWELNLTTAMAYFPLILWAAERAITKRRVTDAVFLGFSFALCAWVGSPPALYFASIFVAIFWLFRCVEELIERRDHRKVFLLSSVKTALFASGIAFGLSAVVILPTFQLAKHSVQSGRSFESIVSGALGPADLWAIIIPQPGNHLYVGLLTLALALFAVISRRQLDHRRLSWFFAISIVLSIGLALGQSGPFFRVAYEIIPGVSVFRLPHRYESWLGPAFGALAAFGLSMLDLPEKRRKLMIFFSILALLSGFGLLLTIDQLGPGLFFIAVGVVCLSKAGFSLKPSHILVGVMLSLLLLIDVSQRLPSDRHTREGPHPGGSSMAMPILAQARSTDQNVRYFDEFGISCRSGTRFSRRDFRGYQDPLLLKSYERIVGSLAKTPRLLEQFNVRYVLTGPHFIHGLKRHYLPRAKSLIEQHGATQKNHGVVELQSTLPPAYWVPLSQVERYKNRPEALRRLLKIAPAPVALLDGKVKGLPIVNAELNVPSRLESSNLEIVSAHDWELDRDTLKFRINAPENGMVVINETWYPGWRAWVNGSERSIYRANALVRGVFVDAGDSEIMLEFSPIDGRISRFVLVLTLVFCFFVFVINLTRRRSHQSSIKTP